MKNTIRILSIVLCLSLMAVCAPMTAFAIEYYDVSVAGLTISSNNADDVFKDGTVSYDPVSNTVTLNHANITSMAAAVSGRSTGVISEINDTKFNVELIGDNVIDLSGTGPQMITYGVASYGDLRIYGNGSLTVKSCPNAVIGNYAIYADEDIYLENNGTICAEAGAVAENSSRSYGIRAIGDIYIEGPKSVECVGYTSGINKKPTMIVAGRDTTEVYGQADVEVGGTIPLDLEAISVFDWGDLRFVTVFDYDVVVNGVRVTSDNEEDVLGFNKVSYDPSTYTLSIYDIRLDTTSTYSYFDGSTTTDYDCIISSGHDLVIKTYGTCNISCETSAENYFTNIFVEGDLEFIGAGKLEMYAPTNLRMSACVFATNNVLFDALGDFFICGAEIIGYSFNMGVYAGNNVEINRAAKGKGIVIQGGTQAIWLGDGLVPYVDSSITTYGAENPTETYLPVTLTDSNYTNYRGLLFSGSTHVLQGDVNEDSFVDMKDVLGLRKYIAKINYHINEIAADVNSDNTIDMKDVLFLRKIISSAG